VKQRNRHPIWRGLLCLVLGLSAWWGVARWLEPKPKWSIDFRNTSSFLVPHADSPDGRYVIANEVLQEGTDRFQPQAIVILDASTGKVLHRLKTEQERALPWVLSSSEWDHEARWRNGMVWRIVPIMHPQQSNIMQLTAWNPEGEAKEQIVHSWTTNALTYLRAHWPEESNIIVTEFGTNWLQLQRCIQTYLAPYLAYRLLNPMIDFSIRSFQSWAVPSTSGEGCRCLASWVLPIDAIYQNSAVSPDGKRIAYAMGYILSDKMAYERAKLLGLTNPTPEELLNCYVARRRGILIYNTQTGQLEHEIKAGAGVYVGNVHWVGNYLVANFQQVTLPNPVDFHVLEQLCIRSSRSTATFSQYSQGCLIYRIGPDGVKLIRHPEGTSFESLGFMERQDTLFGFCGGSRYLLNVKGDQLQVIHQLKVNDDQQVWPGSCLTQWIAQQVDYRISNKWISSIIDWSESKPWLKKWFNYFWPESRTSIQVIDPQSGKELWRWNDHWAITQSSSLIRQFYLLPYQHNPDSPMRYQFLALHSFDMPLKLCSLWWPRLVGVLVAVCAWFLLTYRRMPRIVSN